jgi:hypothetical protein
MPFTDLSDLYGAVNEAGINLVVRHVMRKRPSLFNYGTQNVIDNPSLRCVRIDAAPEVTARGNPLITLEDPIAILGTDGQWGLDFCAQLTEVTVDFYPGSSIALPPELDPLEAQHFAVSSTACAGIGCPSDDFLRRPPPLRSVGNRLERSEQMKGDQTFYGRDRTERDRLDLKRDEREAPKLPPRAIPSDKLNCFCLRLFIEGHFETSGTSTQPSLEARVDGVEIVDIAPQELEDSLECYLRLALQLAILPQLTVALQKLVLDVVAMMPSGISIEIPVGTAQIPDNPSVEDDELRVRINVTTGP